MTFNKALFDTAAPAYDEAVPFFGPLGAMLAEHARIPAGTAVADLGAGKGAVTVGLRHRTPAGPITSIDVSPGMLDAVRARGLADVSVLEADLADLPVADAAFDHAVSGFTLHILGEPERAAAEIRRVLPAGGTLTWSMPGTHPDAEEWTEAYGEIYADFTERLDDPPGEMVQGPPPEDVLAAAGFRLDDHTQQPVELPVGSAQAYWDWTQTHGARWLTDELPEKDAAELRHAVIDSLERLHPDQGRSIMVAPHFFRMTAV